MMTDDGVGVFQRRRRPRTPRTLGAASRGSRGSERAHSSRGRCRPRLFRFDRASEPIAIGAAGFLAGIARLLGAYSPFGIVAVGAAAALCDGDSVRVMPAIAGALIGSAFGGGPEAVMALAISSALLLSIPGGVRKWRPWPAGACVFAASGVGAALAQLLAGQGAHLPVVALCEAAVAGSAAVVIVPAALAWQSREGDRPRPPSRLDAASLLLCAGIVCIGLTRLSFMGVSLGAVAAFYLSALAGAIGGPGAGAIAGGAVGLATSAVGGAQGAIAGAVVAAGAMSGIMGRRNRVFAAPAILLSAMFFGIQMGTGAELTGFLIEASVAAVALIATPTRLVGEIVWRLPCESGPAGRRDECRARVRYLVQERLLSTAEVFCDLSLAYGGARFGHVDLAEAEAAAAAASAATSASGGIGGHTRSCGEGLDQGPRDIASAVAAVRAQACSGCASYNSCWKELLFRTYREIVDVLALAELFGEVDAAGLPQGLGSWCLRRGALAKAAACVIGPMSATSAAQSAGEVSQVLVTRESALAMLSLQAAVAARVLTGAALESRSSMESDEETERAICERLRRAGIDAKCVSVSRAGRGGLNVQVVRASCDRACDYSEAGECDHAECMQTLAPAVSGVVGRSMSIWGARPCFSASSSSQSAEGAEGHRQEMSAECSVRLLPACKYALETEALSVPRTWGARETGPGVATEEGVSGDSYRVVRLGDGRIAVLISDGMGVGEAASAESQAAVSNLAWLLREGLDTVFAVEIVNALMSLRPDSDSFATLDAVVIDSYSGDAEMIKAGAPPAYIRRGSRVTAVGAPSAPLGVSIPAHTASFHYTLEEGDIIVLATDGVTESRSDLPEVDTELARVIRQAPGACSSSMAQAVMNWAGAGTSARGGAGQRASRDDMTVFVARLTLPCAEDAGAVRDCPESCCPG